MTKPFVFVHLDGLPLKPNVSFADLAMRLTDTWLESSKKSASAEVICRSVKDLLRINMVLMVVDTVPAQADWRIDFVRKYGVPTQLLDADVLQKSSNVGGFSKANVLDQSIVGVCQKAIADGRPITGRVDRIIKGARIVASGIIIPDPSTEKAWCVVLGEVHSISAIARDTRFDDVDMSILQLVREGLSAREIGGLLELSRRTVEHRIERMKVRAGVSSIVPLLISGKLTPSGVVRACGCIADRRFTNCELLCLRLALEPETSIWSRLLDDLM